MARHEFEKAQHHFRFRIQALRGAEMRALAVHAEIGVGQARTPVAELRKQRTRLRFVGLQFPHGRAINGARMAVILAHPVRRVAHLPLFGGGVLRFEGKHIVIAPRLAVQITAQPRQEAKGLLQFRRRFGRRQARGFRFPHLRAASKSVDNRAVRPASL